MDNNAIIFSKGILGFEEYTEYLILEDESSGLYYLSVKEEPSIEFVIISPHIFKEEYSPTISESYFTDLGGGADEEFSLYLIVKLAKTMDEITVNLQAPLLIHVERRMGVQAILEGTRYGVKESLSRMIKGADQC
ncbi:MAG: hypothetical protein BEN19_04525 [Epulopiscium sp. Nuni2H_MBin003]|nr:MAG: hypothetical protein BEN19_04525 [Epulopiscium sp. Nuni2H_MBin003]